MENVRPEGTEYQTITYTSVEALRRNVHVRRSKLIRKSPQWYDPGFGAARKWKNGAVASIVYMIQYGDLNINLDKNDILSLMDELDTGDCMYTPSMFHMI